MGKRLLRCKHREHDYQPMKRGAHREQCTKCKDVFPCRHVCEHLDCCAARGDVMPEWCCDPDQARAAMLAELAIIAPTTISPRALRAGSDTGTVARASRCALASSNHESKEAT